MSILERLARRGAVDIHPAYVLEIRRETDASFAGFEVSLPLLPGRSTVGGSPHCDSVIVGCPFDVLCIIKLSPDGKLMSIASGILGAFYDGEPAPLGESLALRAEAEFRADPFLLVIHQSSGSPPTAESTLLDASRFTRILSRQNAVIGLGTMGFAALLLAGFYPSQTPRIAVRPASTLPESGDLSTSEAVMLQMRRRLLELGVSDAAEITAKDGRVELELPTQVSERNLLLAVADEIRLRTRVPIVTKTAVDDRVLSLVSGVSLTPVRAVVGRDGRTFIEGDTIVDDWQVDRIDNDGVIFSRRGEQVALSLKDGP